MLVGVTSGISFARFAGAMMLPAAGGLAIVWGVLALAHRRELARPIALAEAPLEEPFDRALVVKALLVFGGALAGWLAGFSLPLVAIAAGAVMLLIAGRDPAEAFARVEWSLLLFFAALFVVMRGVRDLPLLQALDAAAIGATTGDPMRDAAIVAAAMTTLSNLVSNVPAVILWTPIVPRLPDPPFLWLVVAMSATFARGGAGDGADDAVGDRDAGRASLTAGFARGETASGRAQRRGGELRMAADLADLRGSHLESDDDAARRGLCELHE
jgi:Na+/H+ antiporter NhaD/arsenite permease-like protein